MSDLLSMAESFLSHGPKLRRDRSYIIVFRAVLWSMLFIATGVVIGTTFGKNDDLNSQILQLRSELNTVKAEQARRTERVYSANICG